MRGTSRGFSFGVGAATAIILLAVVHASSPASAGGLSPGAAYDVLAAAAADGDVRAAEMKASIDRFLESKGITLDALGPVRTSRTLQEIGLQQFRLDGSPPWALRVYNVTMFQGKGDVDAYRAFREGALRVLARDDPNRLIEVVVAPDRVIDVRQFGDKLCECDVISMNADVFSEGVWIMRVGSGFDGTDYTTGADHIHATLLGLVESTLDMYSGLSAAELDLTVRSVRLRATASEAARLIGRENVLIADAITDTADAFAGSAAQVVVVNTPDLFEWHARNVLRLELKPTTILLDQPEGR